MKRDHFVRAAALAAALMLLFPAAGRAQAQKEPDSNRTLNRTANRSGTVGKPPALSARSAVLMDAATGRVLYEENAEEKSLIASTTKIMTGLLVCEAGELDTVVAVPAEAAGVEGSSMYLQAGETLTRRELLYGLMLRSGNDAAAALALTVAGSLPAFTAQMNEKAARLGLTQTHFANPHGLDDEENYSTARDLAQLTRAALQNPTFRAVVSTKSVTAAGRTLTNHNKLLWQYPGAIGVKTGYTRTAGRILVSAAERDGRQLIAVTIHDPNDWADHAALLDYGFSHFEHRTLVRAGGIVGRVPVVGGVQAFADAEAVLPFSYPLSQDEEPSFRLLLPHMAFAPCEGEIGTLEVLLDGTRIGSIPLRCAAPVSAAEAKKSFFQRIFGE